MAKLALGDFEDPRRRLAALRNVVIFGRSVTNIIENLRSRVEKFDEWYKPISDEMARDPILKFFYKLRSQILKQGNMPVGSRVDLTIREAEIDRLPRPPNARELFVVDEAGGCGWEVEVSPGVFERYYIELPESWGKVTLSFSEAPTEEKDALKMCEHYLAAMERVVSAAEARWR